jgi:hypothetical protein
VPADLVGASVLTGFHDCRAAHIEWIFPIKSTRIGGAREGEHIPDAIEPVENGDPVIEPIAARSGIPNADQVDVMSIRVPENPVFLALHDRDDCFNIWTLNSWHRNLRYRLKRIFGWQFDF